MDLKFGGRKLKFRSEHSLNYSYFLVDPSSAPHIMLVNSGLVMLVNSRLVCLPLLGIFKAYYIYLKYFFFQLK